MPFNPLVGEFRVHYAGFMDPGFGHSAAGGTGSRVVLEVRSHTVPFILEDGQIIGRLVYERMMEQPEMLYGRDLGSHYQAQGLKLSKHFRSAKTTNKAAPRAATAFTPRRCSAMNSVSIRSEFAYGELGVNSLARRPGI
ncbi:hypothetical protein GMDG_08871 [Pseudogymnoascus destructans 20631-21]|uniref:2'-deoxycytidine 5'-triphosphate deaminase C-terminal domain-containing protein n=1 Tax=Pseudogymnoascus destructans (strain ATCC MYA-4855 / 20631-21) TaxID=658429 RepID=L8FR73_PSED2|nr:hypothetical protein GMDG_08871 [Pseudogymnoascus destructans 20631-21]